MQRSLGFTLIELLVVIVILGCVISVVTLASGAFSGGREMRDEAERLAGTITVLSDEAILDGREYGLLIKEDSYSVLAYDEPTGKWRRYGGKESHRLPGHVRLFLELDGEALSLPQPEEVIVHRDKKDEMPEPQILVLSSGELSAFRLRMEERRQDGVRFLIATDGFQLPSVEMIEEGFR